MEGLIGEERVAIVGHRGVRGAAPENTIAAFELAAAQGADGVELDVRRSNDGRLVVRHDATVDGVALIDHDFDEIRARWPDIPTLEEALDACVGMLVNVELKNQPGEPDFDPDGEVADQVVAMVVERNARSHTIVSSFHPPTVERARSLGAGVRTGQLLPPAAHPLAEIDAIASVGHEAVNPWVGSFNEGDLARQVATSAHAAGLWVIAWTVNDADDQRTLAAAGVDAIIVDDPAAARTALGLD